MENEVKLGLQPMTSAKGDQTSNRKINTEGRKAYSTGSSKSLTAYITLFIFYLIKTEIAQLTVYLEVHISVLKKRPHYRF